MKNENSLLFGFILGAAFGTVLGVLVAPQEGSKTRKQLMHEANQMKDRLDEDFGKYSELVSDKFKETTEEIGQEIDKLVSSATKTTEETIANLEKRLATLRQENGKAEKDA